MLGRCVRKVSQVDFLHSYGSCDPVLRPGVDERLGGLAAAVLESPHLSFLRFPEPLICSSVLQDKLLEEMWKQQDSLEAPAATVAESLGSPDANGGSEDSNPLLERLRALEVKWIIEATTCPYNRFTADLSG